MNAKSTVLAALALIGVAFLAFWVLALRGVRVERVRSDELRRGWVNFSPPR